MMPEVPIEEVKVILVRVNRHLNGRMRSVRINDVAPSTVMPMLRKVVSARANPDKFGHPCAVRDSCRRRQPKGKPKGELEL